MIGSGAFSGGDPEVFAPLIANLSERDPFLVNADYADYLRAQQEVSNTWQDTESWTRKSILNSAYSGKFSSDRAIAEYCDDIWKHRRGDHWVPPGLTARLAGEWPTPARRALPSALDAAQGTPLNNLGRHHH